MTLVLLFSTTRTTCSVFNLNMQVWEYTAAQNYLHDLHPTQHLTKRKRKGNVIKIRMFFYWLFGLLSLWQKFAIVQPFVSPKGSTVGLHRLSRLSIFLNGSGDDENPVADDIDGNLKESSFPRRSFILGISGGLFIAPSAFNSAAAVPSSAIASSSNAAAAVPSLTREFSWPLGKVAFSLLPLAGTSTRRATVEEIIVDGHIWTHDQLQGIVNVNVPVRQVVVQLSAKAGGGLWVLNPGIVP